MKSIYKPYSINPLALMSIFVALCTVGSLSNSSVSFSDFYRDFIAQIGFIGLLLYWVWRNRTLAKVPLTISASRLWLGALLLFALISVFWSDQIGFFIGKYVLWVATAAVFLLTLSLKTEQKNQIIIARSLVFAGAYISTLALIQVLFAVDIFAQAVPPAATFVNKNMAVQVVVLIFPCSLFLLFADKNKSLSRLYPYISALMLAHIFHSNTRAAWFSIGLELFLIALVIVVYRQKIISAISNQILYWHPKQTMNTILATVLLLILVNLSVDGYVPFVDKIEIELGSVYESVQNNNYIRRLIWDAAFNMVQQNPILGTAMGSFYYNMIYDVETYKVFNILRTHNDLLEIAVELGIVGLLLALGAIGSLAHSLFKLINQKNIQQQLFYLGIAIALSGSALNMQASFPYQMAVPLMIFGLYAGLVVKAADGCGVKTKTFMLLVAKYKHIPMGVVSTVFVCILAINVLWWQSFTIISSNLETTTWEKPIISNPLSCHKDITHLLYEIVNFYGGKKKYKHSLLTINSFNQCVPNTWQYNYTKGNILIGLKLHKQGVDLLEANKKYSPKGHYEDYFNQFVSYYKIGNKQKLLEVYQQLAAEPEELLNIKKTTYNFLTRMSIILKKYDDAVKYYKMFTKYHGENETLQKLIKHNFKNQKSNEVVN